MIDNRVSDGPKGLFERAVYTCNHCGAQVVKNPDRTRERGYCRGCDSVICDACSLIRAQTMECKPITKLVDELLTAAEKRASVGSSFLLPH
jgi:hypothetical protein